MFQRAGGAETKDPRTAQSQLGLDVFQAPVPPDSPGAIVSKVNLLLFLLLPHGGELLLGAEAGVGPAFFHQFLGIDVVNLCPLPLAVGTVGAGISLYGSALVKEDAIVLKCVNQDLHGAGNLPLCVCIFHPEEQNAAGLVGHPLGDQALHQIAQVYEAGGTGSHPCDDRSGGYVPGGIPLLQGFRCLGHLGE